MPPSHTTPSTRVTSCTSSLLWPAWRALLSRAPVFVRVQMSMGYRAAPPAYHQPSSHHQQPYGYQPRGGPGYGGRGGYAPHYPPAQYTQPHQYGGPGYGAEPYRGGYGGAGAGAGAGAGGGEGGLTAEEEAWLLEQEDLLAGEADDSGLTAEDFERMALHAAQVRGHTQSHVHGLVGGGRG